MVANSILFISGSIPSGTSEPNVHVVLKGFVNNMADWMAASDLIITKAGPGTIAEACTRGLPVLLNCYLPGQEEGNVAFVKDGHFGGYSPVTSRVVAAACDLLSDLKKRKHASECSLAAMDPTATCRIADDIVKLMIARSMEHRGKTD